MPFPDGTGMSGDPSSNVLAANAAALGEPAPVQTDASAPGMGFPPGLAPAPAAIADEGMPSYLTDPSSFVPDPEARLAGAQMALADPRTAPTRLDLSAVAEPVVVPDKPAGIVQEIWDSLSDDGKIDLARKLPDFLKKSDGDSDSDSDPKHKVCPSCGVKNDSDAKTCKRCHKSLVGNKKQDLAIEDDTHQVSLYMPGVGLFLGQEPDSDGLFWKVACKTGTLALSPGPGQVDMDQPLELTDDLFNEIQLSFAERAFPYVTVPETHANGVLENTGYVKKIDVVDRDSLLADQRLDDDLRASVANDPADTRYLLAGIDFTEPEVKAKAERGSIADTSVGVKFNYRNKRTGKLYKAALEHIALTNVPWVDGLVPFAKSALLSQEDFGGDEAAYDGVYVDLDLAALTTDKRKALKASDFAIPEERAYPIHDETHARNALARVAQYGTDEEKQKVRAAVAKRYPDLNASQDLALAIEFDPKAHPRDFHGKFRSVVGGLKVGEKVQLPDGVTVRKGKEGFYVRPAGRVGVGVAFPPVDDANKAADAALKESTSAGGKGEIPDKLKETDFKKGDIVSVSGRGLARYVEKRGENSHTVESMVSAPGGKSRKAQSHHTTFELEKYHGPTEGTGSLRGLDDPEHRNDTPESREMRNLRQTLNPQNPGSPDADPTKHNPEQLANHQAILESKIKQDRAQLKEWDGRSQKPPAYEHTKARLAKYEEALVKAKAAARKDLAVTDEQHDNTLLLGMRISLSGDTDDYTDIDVDLPQAQRALDSLGDGDRLELPLGVCIQKANDGDTTLWLVNKGYSGPVQVCHDPQSTMDAATTAMADLKLQHEANRAAAVAVGYSQDDPSAESGALSTSEEDETMLPMTPTVEELLASQQAAAEAHAARIAELESQLSLAQGTITAQGDQIKTETVNKRVQALQKAGYPPALCLAAKQVFLQSPAQVPDGAGLNLSVQAATPGADGAVTMTEQKLQTPADVVEFLLASIQPGVEQSAAVLAAVAENVGELQLAQQETTAADAEAKSKATVEQWERENHPERFKDDGKGDRL